MIGLGSKRINYFCVRFAGWYIQYSSITRAESVVSRQITIQVFRLTACPGQNALIAKRKRHDYHKNRRPASICQSLVFFGKKWAPEDNGKGMGVERHGLLYRKAGTRKAMHGSGNIGNYVYFSG